MNWLQVSGTSGSYAWTHWADIPLANAWLAEAVARTTPAEEDRLDKVPLAEQLGAVEKAFIAASNYYRALNVRPASEPTFVAWLRAFAPCFPTNFNPCTSPSVVARAASPWLATLGKPMPVPSNVRQRYSLNLGDASMQRSPALNPGAGCSPSPALAVCNPPTWNALEWYDARSSLDAASGANAVWINVPARWSFHALGELVRVLQSRGAAGVLEDTYTYVILENLKLAAYFGYALPADLARAVANLPADLAAASSGGVTSTGSAAPAGFTPNERRAAVSTILAIGAIVSVAAAPYGAIVGAIAGIIAMIVQIAPVAIGQQVDAFGRPLPVFEIPQIAADRTLPPGYAIDNAPPLYTGDVTGAGGTPTPTPTPTPAPTPAPTERPEFTGSRAAGLSPVSPTVAAAQLTRNIDASSAAPTGTAQNPSENPANPTNSSQNLTTAQPVAPTTFGAKVSKVLHDPFYSIPATLGAITAVIGLVRALMPAKKE